MTSSKDIRWKQRFENFERSYKRLNKYASGSITNELERAGIIHFFEMTFELAWKVLKDYLEKEGFIVDSPRQAIKQAFQMGLIDDDHIWMEALEKRNMTVHTYDEETAKELTEDIVTSFLPAVRTLYRTLSEEW
ncbi:nucleotidyltransferase substrate binding protein [Lentibacillus halophilus]|uniref:Nucleotidyltransferase substrate binding protein n=1 Tax=Lentibacillus halophilus TaxID=295065 RepID=A0ABP3J2G8_9BACI